LAEGRVDSPYRQAMQHLFLRMASFKEGQSDLFACFAQRGDRSVAPCRRDDVGIVPYRCEKRSDVAISSERYRQGE